MLHNFFFDKLHGGVSLKCMMGLIVLEDDNAYFWRTINIFFWLINYAFLH